MQDTYPYFLSAGSTLSLAQFLSAIMCQNHLPEHRKWRLISHWSKEPSAMWHTLFQLICDSMADPVGIRENECVSKGLLASSIHTHNTHTALKKNVSEIIKYPHKSGPRGWCVCIHTHTHTHKRHIYTNVCWTKLAHKVLQNVFNVKHLKISKVFPMYLLSFSQYLFVAYYQKPVSYSSKNESHLLNNVSNTADFCLTIHSTTLRFPSKHTSTVLERQMLLEWKTCIQWYFKSMRLFKQIITKQVETEKLESFTESILSLKGSNLKCFCVYSS